MFKENRWKCVWKLKINIKNPKNISIMSGDSKFSHNVEQQTFAYYMFFCKII